MPAYTWIDTTPSPAVHPAPAIERRADIRRESDYMYSMRSARRRFKAERLSGTARDIAFRAWARRTYNAFACTGKLRALVTR